MVFFGCLQAFKWVILAGVVIVVSVIALPRFADAIAGTETHVDVSVGFKGSIALNGAAAFALVQLVRGNRRLRTRVRTLEGGRGFSPQQTLPIEGGQ